MFIFILSCIPENNLTKEIFLKKNPIAVEKKLIKSEVLDTTYKNELKNFKEQRILNKVEIILPKNNNKKITRNLINSFELSIYKKQIENIELNINQYNDLVDLEILLKKKAAPGKIFIGTLGSQATNIVKSFCNRGILFFSFTSKKELAGECVYLINFFPKDDLRAVFNFFPKDSKIALLYPENYYGNSINKAIDAIALKSNSLVISRVSYKEDLSNARESIKQLGKYELRKRELERQKKILQNNKDAESKKTLKKIEKFETLGNVDFTHLILPDYSIRLLEIAPLLPFYDVDPDKVRFVGTGVWDDDVFFDEPSLQGAIFPGIEENKRKDFFNDYYYIHKKTPLRTATIPYDLVGILSYIVNKKMFVSEAYNFLNNGKIKFDGIDGKFFFKKNIIFRELDILQIKKGTVIKLN